jgi:hypothetical protein
VTYRLQFAVKACEFTYIGMPVFVIDVLGTDSSGNQNILSDLFVSVNGGEVWGKAYWKSSC